MNVIKPGHVYQLDDGTPLSFTRMEGNHFLPGTTSCDLIDVLIHRIQALNKRPNWCGENIKAVFALQDAKKWLELRHKRVHGENK